MFQYSNLWNYGPQYGADWNLTIDIKCVDLTDDTGTWLPELVRSVTLVWATMIQEFVARVFTIATNKDFVLIIILLCLLLMKKLII